MSLSNEKEKRQMHPMKANTEERRERKSFLFFSSIRVHKVKVK